MVRDTLERATEPNLDLRSYLRDAYIHPVFQKEDIEHSVALREEEFDQLVPTKRTSQRNTPVASNYSAEVGPEIDF